MVEHPLKASWRTNLLFPLFPRPGPRDAEDMYGGKTPGKFFTPHLQRSYEVGLAIYTPYYTRANKDSNIYVSQIEIKRNLRNSA